MPSQTAAFDAALATSLAGIPAQAAADGAAVGAAAAKAMHRRHGPATGGSGPSRRWSCRACRATGSRRRRPTRQRRSPTITDVTGFIVPNGRRFLAEGPPALTSERYATDFNQVKAWGSVNSTVRSAEQTLISKHWAGVGTTTASTRTSGTTCSATLARSQGWSGLDRRAATRCSNMTFHDALMTSFTGKFVYGLWRPVTAIREADTDGNPPPTPIPNWLPLLRTPPYPSAPGNMACIGGSLSRVLERLFGQRQLPFSVTWTGAGTNPSVTRFYNGFRELADQEAYSRIWGGIHFLFETLSSLGAVLALGDYAVDNVLRKR